MGLLTKLGIAAGAGALVWLGYKYFKQAAQDFQFNVIGWGKPILNGANLTVPLNIEYYNPTPLPINVDRLQGDIYLLKSGQFVKAAVVDQPVTIAPGKTTQWIQPVLNLQAVFGGNFIVTSAFLAELLTTKKFTIRSDVGFDYGPISIPKQSFTNTIPIS